jgi:hypothetical protein
MSNVHTNENAMAESVVMFAEQATTPSLDGLYVKAAEFVLTPDETFKRKLDLIENASDMSTPQKLEAMKDAEDKHLADKLFCLGIALVILGALSPDGRRLIGSALKRIA